MCSRECTGSHLVNKCQWSYAFSQMHRVPFGEQKPWSSSYPCVLRNRVSRLVNKSWRLHLISLRVGIECMGFPSGEQKLVVISPTPCAGIECVESRSVDKCQQS